MDLNIISWDDLDQGQDLAYKYNGEDFTGLAWEIEPDGTLANDFFLRGLPWGPDRRWSAEGVLLEDENWYMGDLHGTGKRWSPKGLLLEEKHYVRGLVVMEKQWDENGNLIEDFALPETDTRLKYYYEKPERLNPPTPPELQGLLEVYKTQFNGKYHPQN